MRKMKDNEFDLAIVDPPYGIGFAKTHTGKGWVVRENKEWDKNIPTKEYFKELFRISNNQVICGGNYMVKNLPPSQGWIFWDKGQRAFSLADGELIFTSFDRALRVFDYPRGRMHSESPNKFHPTQKPVPLYKWLLKNYAKEGNTILDTHAGSMSSVIASIEMGYSITAFEIDKDYFEAGKKRVLAYLSQENAFMKRPKINFISTGKEI